MSDVNRRLHSECGLRVKLRYYVTHAGPVTIAHVQFWQTENCWRLDSSHRGGRPRDLPCLVDAADVRTVNALEALRPGR